MRPPECEICGIEFAPSEGASLRFVARLDERQDEKAGVQADRNVGWFCSQHMVEAQEYVKLTLNQALRKMRQPLASSAMQNVESDPGSTGESRAVTHRNVDMETYLQSKRVIEIREATLTHLAQRIQDVAAELCLLIAVGDVPDPTVTKLSNTMPSSEWREQATSTEVEERRVCECEEWRVEVVTKDQRWDYGGRVTASVALILEPVLSAPEFAHKFSLWASVGAGETVSELSIYGRTPDFAALRVDTFLRELGAQIAE